MKKVYVLGLFLIMFVSAATAQDETSKSFRGGLKINPLFSWLKTETATGGTIENNGLKFGFSYGVFGDYYFAENYAISGELRIAHQTAAYTYRLNTDPTAANVIELNREVNLQYIEIPVGLKMRTNEVGYSRFYGLFGFVPTINIKAKGDDVLTYGNGTKETKNDLKISGINLFGTYLQIGGGIEYNLGGSTSLLGGITFNNGFVNLVNQKADDQAKKEFRDYNVKPANIAVNLGVIF